MYVTDETGNTATVSKVLKNIINV